MDAQVDNAKDPSHKNVRMFKYDQLVSATNNFASIIGIGGFGYVYKGKIGKQVTFFFLFYFSFIDINFLIGHISMILV